MAPVSGIDVSHHQRLGIDWSKVVQSGQRFVFMRASYVGTVTKKVATDSNFEAHWKGARAVPGLLLSAYHFFVPTPDIREQIEYFLNVVGNRQVDLPLVLDFENNGGMSKDAVSDAILQALQLVEARTGRRPIVYTGPSWWNNNTVSKPQWPSFDLWIANYGNPNGPIIPRDWKTWRIWQYTGTGSVPGINDPVDINTFNGDTAQFQAWVASVQGPQQPTPTGSYRVRVTASSMNMRSGPSTTQAIIGSAQAGQEFPMTGLGGGDVWLQIGANQWVAFATGGKQFCDVKAAGSGVQIVVSAAKLNVRSGTGTSFAVVGDVPGGTALNVSDLGGTDAWVQVGPSQWGAFAKGTQRLMQWIKS
jgi:GH25 family lysozyme M1 (1,4-beta-N-acetylmuramidase)/uncharacterized protein YraI